MSAQAETLAWARKRDCGQAGSLTAMRVEPYALGVSAGEQTVKVELCQWAAVNPDGTHTIVRGGLDHWDARLPFDLLIWTFIEIPRTVGAGNHPFTLEAVSPERLSVARMNGVVSIGPEKRVMFAVPLQASIQAYGHWKVRFTCRELTGESELEVRPMRESGTNGNV